jgi:FixJ family two-component response regulator
VREPLLVTIIDDDDDVRQALGAMLIGSGHDVQCFDSAEAFLECDPVGGQSAVIVSDIQMGGMSGLDLCRALRSGRIDTPMILMTGFATAGIRARAQKIGVSALLEKPFDPVLLLGEVEAATG